MSFYDLHQWNIEHKLIDQISPLVAKCCCDLLHASFSFSDEYLLPQNKYKKRRYYSFTLQREREKMELMVTVMGRERKGEEIEIVRVRMLIIMLIIT